MYVYMYCISFDKEALLYLHTHTHCVSTLCRAWHARLRSSTLPAKITLDESRAGAVRVEPAKCKCLAVRIRGPLGI